MCRRKICALCIISRQFPLSELPACHQLSIILLFYQSRVLLTLQLLKVFYQFFLIFLGKHILISKTIFTESAVFIMAVFNSPAFKKIPQPDHITCHNKYPHNTLQDRNTPFNSLNHFISPYSYKLCFIIHCLYKLCLFK